MAQVNGWLDIGTEASGLNGNAKVVFLMWAVVASILL